MPTVLKFKITNPEQIRRGREYLWSVVRSLPGEFTTGDVLAQTNGERRGTVWRFVHMLEQAGYVKKVGGEDGAPRRQARHFRVIKRPTRLPPLDNSGRQGQFGEAKRLMWNVMRSPVGRVGFTITDLVLYGSTDEVAIHRTTAANFIRVLAKAGYLVEIGRKTWRLKPSMNSGPLPPLVMTAEFVWDQNRKCPAGEAIAEERP